MVANPEDEYWQLVGYLLLQNQGIAAGYSSTNDWKEYPLNDLGLLDQCFILTELDFLLLQLGDELEDVATYVGSPLHAGTEGHCSALINWLEDKSDLQVSSLKFFVLNIAKDCSQFLDILQ